MLRYMFLAEEKHVFESCIYHLPVIFYIIFNISSVDYVFISSQNLDVVALNPSKTVFEDWTFKYLRLNRVIRKGSDPIELTSS